jgi:putative two-component system response regulator
MIKTQKRILIVDDEPLIRKILNQKLTKETYLCEEANCAEQTLSRLDNMPTELVILDNKMPGKWGIELLPQIKAGYPETAVIMVTAIADTNIAVECMKLGADDYICKPFNLDNVAQSVARVMEKQNLQHNINKSQLSLEAEIGEQRIENRKVFLGAIEALVSALEAKDKYTGGHSRRVAELALAIGSKLGLTSNEMEDLRWSSLLHDLGKIAVDQQIQNKPGELTCEEYRQIMIHTHVGAAIVKPVVNERVVTIIEHHHDHFDGRGLDQVIMGDEIHLGARILALADTFDAITSDRPYRPGSSIQEALIEIKRCIGTQFDPVVANVLLKMQDLRKVLAHVES